jgi:hypothetical protein
MQTFLPYPDFDLCAQVLDPKRLGNQAYRECKTLMRGGWANHPASKMWRGFESALARYALALFRELTRRGRHYPVHILFFEPLVTSNALPSWLGDERLHSSHRAALLRKDPVWYGKYGWDDDVSEYFWPVNN